MPGSGFHEGYAEYVPEVTVKVTEFSFCGTRKAPSAFAVKADSPCAGANRASQESICLEREPIVGGRREESIRLERDPLREGGEHIPREGEPITKGRRAYT